MTKLYVKLTDKAGNVFTQVLPKRVLRGKTNGESFLADKKATLAALQDRLNKKDDVLNYGDMSYDIVDEEEHLRVTKENQAKAAEAQTEAETEANKPENVKRRKRVEQAAKDQAALGYVSSAEGVVDLDKRVKAMQVEDDGSDDTLYRVALNDPKIGLIGSLKIQQAGTSYPALTKAVGTAAADKKNDTVEKVQAAALKALGL